VKILKLALIFLGIFLAFSILVVAGLFTQLDQLITVSIQSQLTKALDTPLSFLSLLGTFEITTTFLVIILYFLKLRRSLIVMFMFTIGMGAELLGKIFLYHPGPPKIFFRYNLDIIFPSGYIQTGHSFPSGHSFRTAFLALLISYLIFQTKRLSAKSKRFLSALCFFFLFLMLVSRVSLGEHWTTDVIGGLFLGLGLGYLSVFILERKGLHPKFLRPL